MLRMSLAEKLLFVDLETTGASFALDRITEIGIVAIDQDGNMTRWSTLLNPGIAITPFIEQLTGISNEMVRSAPVFADVMHEVRLQLSDGLFIAHNARFDYGFLQHAFARTGDTLQNEMLCTVKLSRALFPNEKKHNLDMLIDRHGLIPEARHRALADADLLWQLWRKLKAACSEEAFMQAINRSRHRPKIASPALPLSNEGSIAPALSPG
jgi:DNA polymerase-3 subunit epsilon